MKRKKLDSTLTQATLVKSISTTDYVLRCHEIRLEENFKKITELQKSHQTLMVLLERQGELIKKQEAKLVVQTETLTSNSNTINALRSAMKAQSERITTHGAMMKSHIEMNIAKNSEFNIDKATLESKIDGMRKFVASKAEYVLMNNRISNEVTRLNSKIDSDVNSLNSALDKMESGIENNKSSAENNRSCLQKQEKGLVAEVKVLASKIITQNNQTLNPLHFKDQISKLASRISSVEENIANNTDFEIVGADQKRFKFTGPTFIFSSFFPLFKTLTDHVRNLAADFKNNEKWQTDLNKWNQLIDKRSKDNHSNIMRVDGNLVEVVKRAETWWKQVEANSKNSEKHRKDLAYLKARRIDADLPKNLSSSNQLAANPAVSQQSVSNQIVRKSASVPQQRMSPLTNLLSTVSNPHMPQHFPNSSLVQPSPYVNNPGFFNHFEKQVYSGPMPVHNPPTSASRIANRNQNAPILQVAPVNKTAPPHNTPMFIIDDEPALNSIPMPVSQPKNTNLPVNDTSHNLTENTPRPRINKVPEPMILKPILMDDFDDLMRVDGDKSKSPIINEETSQNDADDYYIPPTPMPGFDASFKKKV